MLLSVTVLPLLQVGDASIVRIIKWGKVLLSAGG
jgi:hypothetical protein